MAIPLSSKVPFDGQTPHRWRRAGSEPRTPRMRAIDQEATFGAGRPRSGLGDEAAIAHRSVGQAALRPWLPGDNYLERSYCLILERFRADRALPQQDAPVAASHCQSGRRKSRFPVRSASLLSRPDLAPSKPRRAAKGKRGAEPPGATRSARFRASMARMASTGPSLKRAPWHTPHQSENQAAAPLTSVTSRNPDHKKPGSGVRGGR